MQNLVNDTPTPKKNYEVVDVICCIAMISIAAEHSFLGLSSFKFLGSDF
jgi:hypothetical protein